jgi:hypothetical protein
VSLAADYVHRVAPIAVRAYFGVLDVPGTRAWEEGYRDGSWRLIQ